MRGGGRARPREANDMEGGKGGGGSGELELKQEEERKAVGQQGVHLKDVSRTLTLYSFLEAVKDPRSKRERRDGVEREEEVRGVELEEEGSEQRVSLPSFSEILIEVDSRCMDVS